MAAAAVCLARGVDPDAVRAGLRDVPRRAPPARGGRRGSDGVLYVNDSKATNVASTLVALRSFDAPRPPDRRRAGKGSGFEAAAPRRWPSAAPPST